MYPKQIQMVDLKGQYRRIREEVDAAIETVLESTQFINGPEVKAFEEELAGYLGCREVIGCANGTDALQIALMALNLQPGDEVIVPTFTYVATAEVIALLQLKPVMADVDPHTFNLTADILEDLVTDRTRAVVPVHLFGQSADMDPIMKVAAAKGLFVVEDNAQAIGADYTDASGKQQKAGTVGHIGTTSFFPSKNLGCYGDGGALSTNDPSLAARIRMIANHGQKKKYYHSVIGVNSRLDALQAAILRVKLKYLDTYIASRQAAARHYDAAFQSVKEIETPARLERSTHVFHQYTLKVPAESRDDLQAFLKSKGVPSMIYYPLPLYRQEAFQDPDLDTSRFPVTDDLCRRVLSLPVHTEMESDLLNYISDVVKSYFK